MWRMVHRRRRVAGEDKTVPIFNACQPSQARQWVFSYCLTTHAIVRCAVLGSVLPTSPLFHFISTCKLRGSPLFYGNATNRRAYLRVSPLCLAISMRPLMDAAR